MRRRSDARQHQELRRVERAGAQDHLAARPHAQKIAAAPHQLDPDRARPLDQHAGRMRAGLHLQVGPPPRRPQIGPRRRRAPAVPDGVLAAAEALLVRAVVVGIARKAGGRAGLHPGIEQRVGGLGELRAERAAAAAPGILAALPAFAALEIRQHVRIGPAARAVLRPAVVIGAIAARIGHHVDGGRAAQHLAAHRLDAPPVESRLGLGRIAPIVHAVIVHLAHAERNVDERIAVRPAGLQQQHARARVLAQPVGQHAAGRAGADDDVVVFPGHARSLSAHARNARFCGIHRLMTHRMKRTMHLNSPELPPRSSPRNQAYRGPGASSHRWRWPPSPPP